MRKFYFFFAAGCAFFGSFPAGAGEPAAADTPAPIVDESEQSYQNMLHKKFLEIDKNQDGHISSEEYKTYNDEIEKRRREIMNKAYLDMDRNNDGKISEEEFLERINRRREEIRKMIKDSAASFGE